MGTKNKIIVEYHKKLSFREKLVLWMLEKSAPLHYHFCSKRKTWNLNSDDLLNFPKGTLGNELGLFYKSQNFEPIPKAERHDVFHVLLDYTTGVIDEAAMQFFLLGNGKISVFTFGTAIISTIFFPTKWSLYKKAFIKGKTATDISKWNFKDLLSEDLEKLKRSILNNRII